MTTAIKTQICDIPISCHFSKIPDEIALFGRIIGISLQGWDFIFVLEDDLGDPVKVWGSQFQGDRWNTRWQDDEFDYDVDDEATLLWQRR